MTDNNTHVQALKVTVAKGEDPDLAVARTITGPHTQSALVEGYFGSSLGERVYVNHAITALKDATMRVNDGDLSEVEAMLFSQASALNVMFGELSRKAYLNLHAGYMEPFESFLKLAMKAQNQSRMTLEGLAAVKNPPVVYAKQANIANGPQQVNNGVLPSAGAQAVGNQTPPIKLLEQQHVERMDAGAPAEAGRGDQEVAAMVPVDGADDAERKGRGRSQRMARR